MAGRLDLHNGVGTIQLQSDSTEPFQLSLQDKYNCNLRVASVLRARFRSLPGVQAVFGDVSSEPQPVGFPYPLPLLVLDRLGNVAEDFEGEVPAHDCHTPHARVHGAHAAFHLHQCRVSPGHAQVPMTMSGAARIAGRAPEIFHVVHGRATLPVLTTIAETVTFNLSEAAVIDAEAVAASPFLKGSTFTSRIIFGAAEAQRLVLTVENAGAGGAGGAQGEAPSDVRAGEDVHVVIKALDAFNNQVGAPRPTPWGPRRLPLPPLLPGHQDLGRQTIAASSNVPVPERGQERAPLDRQR